MEKLPKIAKAKQIGKNFNIVLDNGEQLTKTGSKEELVPLKEAVKLYTEKPTKKNYNSLIALAAPKKIAEAKKVEKTKEETKARIKKIKKEEKALKGSKSTTNKKVAKATQSIVSTLKNQLKDGSITEAEKNELLSLLGVSKEVTQKQTAPAPSQRTGRKEY